MKERPILFSGEMVRAILDGRKTQTRRVVKTQLEVGVSVRCDECYLRKKPIGRSAPLVMANSLCDRDCPGYGKTPPPGDLWPGESRAEFGYGFGVCPYGAPGDRLWVKETWRVWEGGSFSAFGEPLDPDIQLGPAREGMPVEYRATTGDDGPWRSSIYMPRWASRITLEITDIRAERVQDITNANIRAEGMPVSGDGFMSPETPRIWFRDLWDSINGKKPGRSWRDNPWVWVIEFRRVES